MRRLNGLKKFHPVKCKTQSCRGAVFLDVPVDIAGSGLKTGGMWRFGDRVGSEMEGQAVLPTRLQ